MRADEQRNKLYEINNVIRSETSGRKNKYSEADRAELLAKNYPLNVKAFQDRYSPPVKHIHVLDDEYRRYMISIDGVIIRYDESSYDIFVTVEGVLSDDVIAALKQYGLDAFSELEATPYKIIDF